MRARRPPSLACRSCSDSGGRSWRSSTASGTCGEDSDITAEEYRDLCGATNVGLDGSIWTNLVLLGAGAAAFLLEAIAIRRRSWRPMRVTRAMLAAVDYGDPISYVALQPGVDVVSADGAVVGVVEHVLRDEQSDIFDGIVIDANVGDGGARFVDAPEVSEIRQKAVLLAVPAADVEHLPKPGPSPAVMDHHGVEDSEGPLEHKLRRAWELISGRG